MRKKSLLQIGLFSCFLAIGFYSSSGGGTEPEDAIKNYYLQMQSLFSDSTGADDTHQRVSHITECLFDIDRLAPQIIGQKWEKITSIQQERFKAALTKAIAEGIYERAEKHFSEGQTFDLIDADKNPGFANLTYRVQGKEIKINLLQYPGNEWKITNITSGKNSVRRHFYKLGDNILDDYSIQQFITQLSEQGYVVLEDFESSEVGKLPLKWTWKDSDDKENKPYVVKSENGNQYLAATDNGESVIIGKQVRWNLKEYPYISFRWRASHLPVGGDERIGEKNDSGAAVYITYKKKLGLIPESIKFVWSTTLPVGTATRRSGTGRPWNIVAESGEENLDQWRTYTFNAYEAYKKTFGGDPPDSPIGVGILSDANSTHSKAYADYDDIRALRSANADSGIKQFMKGE